VSGALPSAERSTRIFSSGEVFLEPGTKAGENRTPKVKAIVLSIAVVCFNAFGNLSLAWGMKHLPPVGVRPLGYVEAMVNPYVATGISLLILWLLTRMALMSWADLSFALPLMAMGYVVAAALGRFVLDESVGFAQWAGIFLIFAGSAVVSTTQHCTVACKTDRGTPTPHREMRND
jgi:drug/metabolite transporter (DMT)-like permease